MKAIAYIEDDSVRVMFIAPGLDVTIEEIAARDVPSGHEWIIVDVQTLPKGGLQETWTIENGIVVVDPVKMKSHVILQAELKRTMLIHAANDYITQRQWPGKASIGRLKDDELVKYNLWLDYLDILHSDTTDWPQPPEA